MYDYVLLLVMDIHQSIGIFFDYTHKKCKKKTNESWRDDENMTTNHTPSFEHDTFLEPPKRSFFLGGGMSF